MAILGTGSIVGARVPYAEPSLHVLKAAVPGSPARAGVVTRVRLTTLSPRPTSCRCNCPLTGRR